EHEDTAQLRRMHEEQTPDLDVLPEDVPEDVITLIDSLLSKNPTDRPSAEKVVGKLQGVAKAKPGDDSGAHPHEGVGRRSDSTKTKSKPVSKPPKRPSRRMLVSAGLSGIAVVGLIGFWVALSRTSVDATSHDKELQVAATAASQPMRRNAPDVETSSELDKC